MEINANSVPSPEKSRILITGARGFLGSYVIGRLLSKGFPKSNLITPTFAECDFLIKEDCVKAVNKCDYVIHLAGKVGDSTDQKKAPGQFFYENILMGLNVLEASREAKIKKTIFVGSINSYPANAIAPFKESYLWQGYPEEANASYAIAKLAILVGCQAYHKQYNLDSAYLIFPNLYGPWGDCKKSQSFFSYMVKKICIAVSSNEEKITFSGTGLAEREFLYISDAAEAIVQSLKSRPLENPINIGTGKKINLRDLSVIIATAAGFKGKIEWVGAVGADSTRTLDISYVKNNWGFEPAKNLKEGVKETITWYLNNCASKR
ncbi:MAG: NAD-dependent epimerase/dehydratase family protein [Candidatus Liptonbacteria bacterium]|nr:NAD-dependent epimerase/dehydratase family protein [Candidatus Liptonbacteria bacterium]